MAAHLVISSYHDIGNSDDSDNYVDKNSIDRNDYDTITTINSNTNNYCDVHNSKKKDYSHVNSTDNCSKN